MKLFFKNLKRYGSYLRYAPISILKTEVADTYLNWLWWFLDPLLFMFVYTFMAKLIFNSKILYFPLFIFIGLNAWNIFDRSVKRGLNMVRNYKTILSKTYVPKYILVLVRMTVETIKIGCSYLILIVMMIIYKVPLTWHLLELPPLFILLFLLSFAGSMLMLHCGVYVSDLNNIVSVSLRLLFYMTGIFYNIETKSIMEKPVMAFVLLNLNPVGIVIRGMRNCILYGKSPEWDAVLIWFAVALFYCALGVHLIHKHEHSYVKIV